MMSLGLMTAMQLFARLSTNWRRRAAGPTSSHMASRTLLARSPTLRRLAKSIAKPQRRAAIRWQSYIARAAPGLRRVSSSGHLLRCQMCGSSASILMPNPIVCAPTIVTLAQEASNLFDVSFDEASVEVVAGHAGPAYGVPHALTIEAIRLAGRLEALPLDPVYSGKSLAGLIALIREGRWRKNDDVVFVHTGGAPSLFAYQSVLGI